MRQPQVETFLKAKGIDPGCPEAKQAAGMFGGYVMLVEKRWALTVLEVALVRLRLEFAASEHPGLFDVLKPALTGDKLDQPYSEIAASIGLSESAIKVAVHRMRKRFGELLRRASQRPWLSPIPFSAA